MRAQPIEKDMSKIRNPFIVKGEIPDEYFCDRKKESELLITNIINGRNILLTSPRRMGKTGLIEYCFRQKELQDYYTFFIDILQTSSLRELTYALGKQILETLRPQSKKMVDLFVSTVRSISTEFSYDVLSGMPKFSFSLGNISNPEYTLEEIFKYLDLADKRCVIAIDEFQQITRYPEKNVEAVLRTHIQHCGNADFIFAGSERHILAEMFNSYSRPFYASTTMMALNEIPKEVYRDFCTSLFHNFGKEIETGAIDEIYELFAGNTYCMQRTMNIAFAHTDDGQTATAETIREAIDDILQTEERSFQTRLSLLTPKPKEMLFAIAKDGVAKGVTSGAFVQRHHLSSQSSAQSAIKQLLSDDWISYSADENGARQYMLTDPFLCLWLQRQY